MSRGRYVFLRLNELVIGSFSAHVPRSNVQSGIYIACEMGLERRDTEKEHYL